MKIQIVETKTYKYSELSDQAKQHAIEKQQESAGEVYETEYIYDDAVNMGTLLGIEIDTHTVKLMGGTTRQDPTIYYSGFWSQGDGACFEGSYRYMKGAPAAIKAETSAGRDDASKGDRELLRIAEGLQEVQRRNFYQLRARTTHRGHYYHSGCMSVDVERYDDRAMTDDAEEEITQLLRDFADWIYRQLENEYNYQTSEEAALESIEANDYDFTEDGEIY